MFQKIRNICNSNRHIGEETVYNILWLRCQKYKTTTKNNIKNCKDETPVDLQR